MSTEAVEYLVDEIVRAIDYARKEYDLTNTELLGILELIKNDLHAEAREEEADEGWQSGRLR